MRILQKTISILLAVQLLVSFGLCGGLCCVKVAELSAPQVVEQAAEPEENLPPCHRKKAAEMAAAKQDHKTHSAHNTLSTHQTHSAKQVQPAHQKSDNRIAASFLHRNCCAMKREAPDGEPLPSNVAPQSAKLIAVIETSSWLDGEIVFGPPKIPVQISTTHSPPHTGFQLSLRI